MEDSRIESWKKIAAFFGRDERTVKRWEKTRSLPIHRLPGEKGGVFAYTRELTLWLDSAKNENPVSEVPALGRRSTDLAPGRELAKDATEFAPSPSVSARESSDSVAAQTPSRSRAGQARPIFWFAVVASALVLAAAGLTLHVLTNPFRNSTSAGSNSAPKVALLPDPAAQDAYLKGRYYWNHRTGGSLRQAVEAFQQAVARDPTYAPAYAGLADSYNLMPQFSSMPKSQAFPLALSAARKAVALDDSLSEAHRALAFALFYWEWDVNAAFHEFQRAIQLDPKDVDAHNWYATALMLDHRNQAALAEAEKARELDPTSRVVLVNRAFVLYWTGDRAAGVAKLKQLEHDEPDFLSPPLYLARIFFYEQKYPEYIAELKRAATISRDPQKAELAGAAERGWSHGGERGLLEQLRRFYQHAYQTGQGSGYDIAHICAMLDRKEEADRYLHAAIDARDFEAMSVFYGEFNAHMAGDPGFEQLKQKISQRMNRSPATGAGR